MRSLYDPKHINMGDLWLLHFFHCLMLLFKIYTFYPDEHLLYSPTLIKTHRRGT